MKEIIPEKLASDWIQIALHSSFEEFKNAKFRELVGFSEQGEEEQDRIYNELTVSALVLAWLMLDSVQRLASGEKHDLVRASRDVLPQLYMATIVQMGVPDEFVKMWGKLIALRRDEYKQDRNDNRALLPEIDKGNPWVQTVSIGCLHHIRRGDTSSKDELYPHLTDWIAGLSIGYEKKAIKYL